jgi:acylphosphatase
VGSGQPGLSTVPGPARPAWRTQNPAAGGDGAGQAGTNDRNKNIARQPRLWLHWPVRQAANSLLAMTMSRRRMQILYSGHVQGVGFRYTARATASGYEVTGTVRNLPDGRVELVAEGDAAELEAFREAIRHSGLAACIRHETVSWSEARGDLRGFEIVR